MTDTKRGRPPLDADDRTVQVTLRLPSKQHTDLRDQAQREAVTVQEIIRRTLRDRLE